MRCQRIWHALKSAIYSNFPSSVALLSCAKQAPEFPKSFAFDRRLVFYVALTVIDSAPYSLWQASQSSVKTGDVDRSQLCLSVCMSWGVCVCACLCVCLLCLAVCMSLDMRLSIYTSRLFIFLPVCLSVYALGIMCGLITGNTCFFRYKMCLVSSCRHSGIKPHWLYPVPRLWIWLH